MPCMWNGKPVAGNKGSCPYGSTWVEPQAQTPTDDRNWMQKGIGYAKENPLEVGSYAAMLAAVPFTGGGSLAPLLARGGMTAALKGAGKKMTSSKLLNNKVSNKLLRETKNNPIISPKTGLTMGTKQGTRFSPNKIGGLAAMGAGGYGLYASGADDRLAQQQALQTQQTEKANDAMNANTKALMDANATKAEADRVAGLNPLEAMMENMKKKGFWTDPINKDGPKTDTKLNRLGILMDYYGKDPVQRAASISPSKQFAQSDKEYADTQAAYASAQATLAGKSPFGTLGTTGIAKGLEPLIKERYDSFFGGIADEDVAGVAARVASVMQQLAGQYPTVASQAGGIDRLREEALKQVEKELGL